MCVGVCASGCVCVPHCLTSTQNAFKFCVRNQKMSVIFLDLFMDYINTFIYGTITKNYYTQLNTSGLRMNGTNDCIK